ncbi:histone-lysine N-methyltransferase SETMAR [Trichonephila clavipes]|nr:histone-lysine N-methyltransferase SETMAR [Trichonephila clavipes]
MPLIFRYESGVVQALDCQQPFFSVASQNLCVYLSSRVIALDKIETYCATEVYGAEPFTGRLTDDGLKDFREDRRENRVGAREHYRVITFYDFKAGFNQKECSQRLQLAFDDESQCRDTVFRWFKEFCSGRNSLQDEEHTKKTMEGSNPG